jgi:hypothetical protein
MAYQASVLEERMLLAVRHLPAASHCPARFCAADTPTQA